MKAQPAKIQKRLYSMEEAALYLGRSPWTVAEMTRTGAIPFIQHGKRKFLDLHDLDRWIETNKKSNLD